MCFNFCFNTQQTTRCVCVLTKLIWLIPRFVCISCVLIMHLILKMIRFSLAFARRRMESPLGNSPFIKMMFPSPIVPTNKILCAFQFLCKYIILLFFFLMVFLYFKFYLLFSLNLFIINSLDWSPKSTSPCTTSILKVLQL